MITIPRRKQKIKYTRKFACKHLQPRGYVSNSLQPLCECVKRELMLGLKAYVCQVCQLYTQSNRNISDVYDESKKLAEKIIKDKADKLKLELKKIVDEDEIDLTTDEFSEDETKIPLKFEKRKAGKADMGDSEEFTEVECPFCGELFDDLASHIQECEFAPDDVSIRDIMPSKSKKKKKKATSSSTSKKTAGGSAKQSISCPYCNKNFQRLGRHIKACKKRPEKPDEEKEAKYIKGEIDSI